MSLSCLLALGTSPAPLCCLVPLLSVRAFALFNCILFCLLWLLSLIGLLFSEGRQKGVMGERGGRGELRGIKRNGGKGNCG